MHQGYKIIGDYPIPFLETITMPWGWAHWIASQGTTPNLKIKETSVVEGNITWEYKKHGLLPWMEFFYDWRFADLTGEGKIGFILVCGAIRQIAYNHEGSILWQYEDPSAGFMDIRPDSNFPVYDMDDDGIPELIGPRLISKRLHLCIINARTGQIKKAVPYPSRETMPVNPKGGHLRSSVTIINADTRKDILVGWDYRSLTLLDRNMNLLWEKELYSTPGRQHMTMGHTPHNLDIDGDGSDEILASSCLLDHDGSILWVAPDLPALVRDGHADSVQMAHLTSDMNFNVVMSTGAYVFNSIGEFQWGRDDLLHGQVQRVAKIRTDIPGNQLIVYEGASRVVPDKPDKVVVMNREGKLLWEFEVVQPDIQEGGFGFWTGDWDGDGCEEIFVNDQKNVIILDGSGKVMEKIPGHLIYVFDLFGDKRAEAIVLTGIEPGMKMQVISNAAPNPHPETNREITYRGTTLQMANCTRY